MTGEGWTIDATGRAVLTETTARAVRAARLAAGLSQEKLGLAAGVTAGVISGLECRRSVPTLDSAARIARSLILPASCRRAILEAAKRHPEETSVFETCGWTVDAQRHPDGRLEITAVTPRAERGLR